MGCLRTNGSECAVVGLDEILRKTSIGNGIKCVAQDQLVVSVFADLEAVTEPIQLACGKFRLFISMAR